MHLSLHLILNTQQLHIKKNITADYIKIVSHLEIRFDSRMKKRTINKIH